MLVGDACPACGSTPFKNNGHYRAVDKAGHTIDFLLAEQWEEHAAKCF
jgi:hypothetical protein